jgi:hypothetical protein
MYALSGWSVKVMRPFDLWAADGQSVGLSIHGRWRMQGTHAQAGGDLRLSRALRGAVVLTPLCVDPRRPVAAALGRRPPRGRRGADPAGAGAGPAPLSRRDRGRSGFDSVGFIAARNVVDGQQRLTTLQLLLDAAREVTDVLGRPMDANGLRVLVRNDPQIAQHHHEMFKVWPTDRDRSAFRTAMSGPSTDSEFVEHSAYRWPDCTVRCGPCTSSRGLLGSRLCCPGSGCD